MHDLPPIFYDRDADAVRRYRTVEAMGFEPFRWESKAFMLYPTRYWHEVPRPPWWAFWVWPRYRRVVRRQDARFDSMMDVLHAMVPARYRQVRAEMLEKIHTDVWGPVATKGLNDA